MHTLIVALLLLLGFVTPLRAGQDPEIASPSADDQPVELGNGIVLPRHAFDEIMSRPDGIQMIDRMQERAENSRRFDGVPQIVLLFVPVLLFFWSAMIYYQVKHARLHRTIRMLVEKGVPVPAEFLRAAEHFDAGSENGSGNPLTARQGKPYWASNLMWGGLLWIAIGLAGGVYMYLRKSDAWPWAIASVIYGGASVLTAVAKRDVKI